MAAAGGGSASLSGSASTWPLKRYGRFLPPTDGDEEQTASSWQVFESSEESGHLILTIVVSGHFFISHGRTVLEGFSLIDCHKWLKIVRRADCLLLCAKSKEDSHNEIYMLMYMYSICHFMSKDMKCPFMSKDISCPRTAANECRMFRVQFGGDSKQQMLEHCCNCVQKLAEYVPVQVTDEQSQNLCHSLSGGSQVEDAEQVLHVPDEPLPDSYTSLGERRSVTQLAQSVLKQKFELPLVYRHSVWSAQELGPFIRLCLMDQNFPAFVEDVEKELKKLAEG